MSSSSTAPSKAHFNFLEQEIVEQVTLSNENLSQLNSVLDTFGFAIINNVIPTNEIADFEKAFALDLLSMFVTEKSNADAFKTRFGIDIASPNQGNEQQSTKTFKQQIEEDPSIIQKVIRNFPMNEIPLGHKFFSDWGIPQGRLCWKTRLYPNVQKVFSSIYNNIPVSELCTGTDVVFFENQDPAPVSSASSKKTKDKDDEENKTSSSEQQMLLQTPLWPHTDQNSKIYPGGDHRIFQALVYLWSTADPATRENTSTTVVWPKSHKKQYDELMAMRDWSGASHYCPWPESRFADFIEHGRRVPVPAGAMLVFSSKLIHQGWNPENGGGKRLTIPVSMEPKKERDPRALCEKLYAVLSGNPTTHWASLGNVATRIPNVAGRYNRSASLTTVLKEMDKDNKEECYEMDSVSGDFRVGAKIHKHFQREKESEFWTKANNRKVGNLELGMNWIMTKVPAVLGGGVPMMPTDKLPQCALDML